jgi:hypothetical protein
MKADARLTTLTRVGFATRGLLYLVIAFLILRSGRAEDTSSALEYLGDGGGRLLLIVMAAGLFAYGLWRLSDAALNIERHEPGGKGALERAGAAASGLVHLFLAWRAVRLISGVASSGDGTRQGAETALQLPGGELLLIGAGLVLLAVGVFQLVKSIRGTFLRYLEPEIARQPWAQWSGRVGYAARGLIFLISGYFLVKAGMTEQASEAGGTAEALSWLTSPVDLLVAIGLLGFGLFSLIEARFRILHDVPVDGIVQRVSKGRA